MCGHLNLKLAVSLNVKSIFRVSQSASFLLCTSMIGGESLLFVSLIAFLFYPSCLLQASIHDQAQQAYTDYFMSIIQAYDGVQLKNY